MTEKVLSWFATSPLSTAARIGIGAALVFILDNVTAFNLPPASQVLVVAVVSSALRWFNPKDGVYGVGETEVAHDND